MGIKVILASGTPNPAARKYQVDTHLGAAFRSYGDPAAASGDPLGAALLRITGVERVLLVGDFVTVNRKPSARWSDIDKEVKRVLAAAGPADAEPPAKPDGNAPG